METGDGCIPEAIGEGLIDLRSWNRVPPWGVPMSISVQSRVDDLSAGQDPQDAVLAVLLAERDPDRLWQAFSGRLAELGFDKLNYTVFLPSRSLDAPDLINPSLSTMPAEWLADYAERRLDLIDPLVDYVSAGGQDPILFDATAEGDIGEVARTARRAGRFAPPLRCRPRPWRRTGWGPVHPPRHSRRADRSGRADARHSPPAIRRAWSTGTD